MSVGKGPLSVCVSMGPCTGGGAVRACEGCCMSGPGHCVSRSSVLKGTGCHCVSLS